MFTIADLIERMTIQGNVVIRVYDSIKEDMIKENNEIELL